MHVNLKDFRLSREKTEDVTAEEHEGYGYEDQYPPGTVGYLYNGGNLFIELVKPGACESADQYHTELFGADYFGTLADCEAELWHAALCEGVVENASAMNCASNKSPCYRRQRSDDNTCEHYPEGV